MTKLKLAIVAISVITVIGVSVPTSIYAYNNYKYNKNVELGDQALNDGNFDSSLSYYNQALDFNGKRKVIVDSKIKLVEEMKESELNFNEGIILFNDKKYLEAIEIFGKVSDKDIKNYNLSKEKTNASKLEYINMNISEAKASAQNKDYSNALVALDNALKIDSANSEVIGLKSEYDSSIKAIQADKAKKLQEEAIVKQKETTKISTQKSAPTTVKVSETQPKDNVTVNNGWFVITDSKGNLADMFGIRSMNFGIQPDAIYYSFLGNDLDYTITVYAPKKTIVKSGKSSVGIQLIPVDIGYIPYGESIKVSIEATYRGKKYSTTFSRVINDLFQ
jgi:tetratricopeptide (TPR) repeat protein